MTATVTVGGRDISDAVRTASIAWGCGPVAQRWATPIVGGGTVTAVDGQLDPRGAGGDGARAPKTVTVDVHGQRMWSGTSRYAARRDLDGVVEVDLDAAEIYGDAAQRVVSLDLPEGTMAAVTAALATAEISVSARSDVPVGRIDETRPGLQMVDAVARWIGGWPIGTRSGWTVVEPRDQPTAPEPLIPLSAGPLDGAEIVDATGWRAGWALVEGTGPPARTVLVEQAPDLPEARVPPWGLTNRAETAWRVWDWLPLRAGDVPELLSVSWALTDAATVAAVAPALALGTACRVAVPAGTLPVLPLRCGLAWGSGRAPVLTMTGWIVTEVTTPDATLALTSRTADRIELTLTLPRPPGGQLRPWWWRVDPVTGSRGEAIIDAPIDGSKPTQTIAWPTTPGSLWAAEVRTGRSATSETVASWSGWSLNDAGIPGPRPDVGVDVLWQGDGGPARPRTPGAQLMYIDVVAPPGVVRGSLTATPHDQRATVEWSRDVSDLAFSGSQWRGTLTVTNQGRSQRYTVQLDRVDP